MPHCKICNQHISYTKWAKHAQKEKEILGQDIYKRIMEKNGLK